MTTNPTRRVAAAIILHQNKILATQRGHGAYAGYWEFPGGKLEEGETSEEACVREIREELDCDICVERFFMTVEHEYPEFHLVMDCYLCTADIAHLHLLEHSAAKWLGKDDLWSVGWLPADVDVLKKLEEEVL